MALVGPIQKYEHEKEHEHETISFGYNYHAQLTKQTDRYFIFYFPSRLPGRVVSATETG